MSNGIPKEIADYYEALLLKAERPKNMEKDFYPSWICTECAKKNGGTWPKGHVATFHNGTCGWCNQEAGVTEPRDWRYPKYENKN